MDRVSSRDLFKRLDGQVFDNYQQLQEAVLRVFNQYLAAAPPRYSYLQLIEWGKRNSWIVPADGRKFRITLEEGQPSTT